MSPTVFRSGPYRFYFFSREELRMHIHVDSSVGEAKYWMEPAIELAQSYRLPKQELNRIRKLIEENEDVIRSSWNNHFVR